MSKFNIYRDGKVHINKRMCSTCIFRPHAEDLRTRVVKEAIESNTAVVCHHTLGTKRNAVCRGFYDHHQTIPLIWAKALDRIEWEDAGV